MSPGHNVLWKSPRRDIIGTTSPGSMHAPPTAIHLHYLIGQGHSHSDSLSNIIDPASGHWFDRVGFYNLIVTANVSDNQGLLHEMLSFMTSSDSQCFLPCKHVGIEWISMFFHLQTCQTGLTGPVWPGCGRRGWIVGCQSTLAWLGRCQSALCGCNWMGFIGHSDSQHWLDDNDSCVRHVIVNNQVQSMWCFLSKQCSPSILTQAELHNVTLPQRPACHFSFLNLSQNSYFTHEFLNQISTDQRRVKAYAAHWTVSLCLQGLYHRHSLAHMQRFLQKAALTSLGVQSHAFAAWSVFIVPWHLTLNYSYYCCSLQTSNLFPHSSIVLGFYFIGSII